AAVGVVSVVVVVVVEGTVKSSITGRSMPAIRSHVMICGDMLKMRYWDVEVGRRIFESMFKYFLRFEFHGSKPWLPAVNHGSLQRNYTLLSTSSFTTTTQS
ncbi:unnamed protein product, partial [Alternaria burnsii]